MTENKVENHDLESAVSESDDQMSPESMSGNDGVSEKEQQFVAFLLDGEVFAFPVLSVQEVVRVPEMVHVPLSPPGLRGLANLHGNLLPVMSLRVLFDMEEEAPTESTRVIVVDVGTSVGFIVDQISRVVTVEQETVETVSSLQSTVMMDLLSGVVKNAGGFAMVMLLDAARLVKHEYAGFGTLSSKKEGRFSRNHTGASPEKTQGEAGRETQLVSYLVNGQEYAFPIDCIEEIARVPEEISQVPNSASPVLGLVNVCDRLLPLVSLREMFHFEQPPLNEHNRIVVVSLDKAGEQARSGSARSGSVGIVVDQIKGELSIPEKMADNVPVFLSSGSQSVREIRAICRLEKGKRLISILDVKALFEHEAFKEALDVQSSGDGNLDRVGTGALDGVEDNQEEDVQLVVFRLGEGEYGVKIDSVQEIIRVPEQLTTVPRSPEFIEGMLNLHGAVLPVVDLRCRLDLEALKRHDQQRILVFIFGGIQTGFIVDSVTEILTLSGQMIEEVPGFSSDHRRIVGWVANLEDKKRMIQILEAEHLLDEEQRKVVKKVHKPAA